MNTYILIKASNNNTKLIGSYRTFEDAQKAMKTSLYTHLNDCGTEPEEKEELAIVWSRAEEVWETHQYYSGVYLGATFEIHATSAWSNVDDDALPSWDIFTIEAPETSVIEQSNTTASRNTEDSLRCTLIAEALNIMDASNTIHYNATPVKYHFKALLEFICDTMEESGIKTEIHYDDYGKYTGMTVDGAPHNV